MFESLVNLEGCKTGVCITAPGIPFESLVNLEGCKTGWFASIVRLLFESLVNLEGCKTDAVPADHAGSLRVLLI